MLIEAISFFCDLFITLLETLDQLSKIRNWNFEILSVVALVVCQAVYLKWLCEWLRNLPDAILAHK